MKAIRVSEFGGPEALRVEELPDPQPGRGEVAVRIHAVGVNPVDAYIRTGTYARKPSLPYTPGSDGAGVVLGVGDGISHFQPGQRVYLSGSTTGTYAEQALCTESQVHRLPEQASFAQGAALGVPYATAYRALFQRANAVAGETVLVHGASGGVGIAAVQLARAAGLWVIGTAGTAEGRGLVQSEGAQQVLDHSADGYFDHLMQLSGGRGVDIILEMLANKNLGKDLGALAPRGRVVVIGSRGNVEINPRDLMGRDGCVIGMTLFNVSERELASIHAALVAGLEKRTLRPVIGQELPLAQAARAHQEVMKPSGARGKIVLVP